MSKEIYSSDPASLKKTTLTQELEQFSRQRGADLWGIADLAPARDFIASQGPHGSPSFLVQYPWE